MDCSMARRQDMKLSPSVDKIDVKPYVTFNKVRELVG